MKHIGLLGLIACAALMYGCAANVPTELLGARLAYKSASAGPAAQLAPAELHKAQEALAQAEKSFSADAKSFRTLDLAYVAQRKAEMADAQASIVMEQNKQSQAEENYQVTQGGILRDRTQELNQTRSALAVSELSGRATAEKLSAEQTARSEAERRAIAQSMLVQEKTQDLNEARTDLAVSERSGQATAQQLSAERAARLEAEKETADAQAALANLALVKEEERGMVITLSGSVLFRSDDSILMPGAESRLDQVVDALSPIGDRKIVVEGYTDSQGSDDYNVSLSQRRADAVRNYLVHRGYPADQVQAHGIGEGSPVADNATSEGRANNRRVEIVLERQAQR